MKKIFAIAILGSLLTSCASDGNNENAISESSIDTMATNDYMTDTTAGVLGDSTSASGNHGEGSGSRVGGGVSGGPQGRSSDSTNK